MAEEREEKAVPRRSGREQGAQQQCGASLDIFGRFEACCPSAGLVVRPRVLFLDGPAGLALASRQGRAVLRAVAALDMVVEEDL